MNLTMRMMIAAVVPALCQLQAKEHVEPSLAEKGWTVSEAAYSVTFPVAATLVAEMPAPGFGVARFGPGLSAASEWEGFGSAGTFGTSVASHPASRKLRFYLPKNVTEGGNSGTGIVELSSPLPVTLKWS